ncbi:MAG: hypothetical protein IKT17_05505 [Lachnospiraceae bacterium]|nr:hypothetical protein [Lachnospiraceae bacterium]
MTDIIGFDEFTDELKCAVSVRYPESDVEIRRVTKNNGVIYTGLTIRNEDEQIFPTMYLEGFYDEAPGGRLTDELTDKICEIYESRRLGKVKLPGALGDYDAARGNLRCKLINSAANEEYLKDVIHRDFLDLAIVPYYLFDQGDLDLKGSSDATFVIRPANLEMWGVEGDEVLDESIRNTLKDDSISIRGMYELLSELNPSFASAAPEEFKACPMYVMTSGSCNGAVAMLNEEKLREFCDHIDSDLYVIPSSINEVILVPRDDTATRSMFDEMICEINDTQLDAVDVLSDHVYCYDRVGGYKALDSY